MRRIGLAVVLALSLASPLPIGAQPAGRVARVGEFVADPPPLEYDPAHDPLFGDEAASSAA